MTSKFTITALMITSIFAATTAPASAFNPQPEPPGRESGFVNPGSAVGFNPQPEPPGRESGFVNPGSAVGFNPQPEPPGKGHLNILR